jgi:uncharacterized protein (TIRG00374 family)
VRGTSVFGWWKAAASIGLAAALFAYFIARVPLADVGRSLAQVKPYWLVLSVLLALTSYTLRALRWGIILRPVGPARVGDLWGCTAAGFAANTILPARAGEVVRPLLLSARSGLPAAATLASILTERIMDLASMLLLFAVGALLARRQIAPGALAPLRDAAVLTFLALLGVIAVVVLLLRGRERAVAFATARLPAKLRDRGRRFLDHLLDGLAVLRSPSRLVQLTVWSLAVWVVASVQVEALARAFALSVGLPASFILLAMGGVGLVVPTPAGVGGFHAAMQFALTRFFGIDLPTATAFALLHHGVCFFPITIAGLIYAAAVGFKLGGVPSAELEVPPVVEGD